MDVDDGFADAGTAELVEHMIEQGAARHLHQGLWHPVCQRAHAQPKAGGEDHGFGGLDGHLRNFSNCYYVRIMHEHRESYHAIPAAHYWVIAIIVRYDGCTTAVID